MARFGASPRVHATIAEASWGLLTVQETMAEGRFWDAGLEEDRDTDRVVANAEREPQAREKGVRATLHPDAPAALEL